MIVVTKITAEIANALSLILSDHYERPLSPVAHSLNAQQELINDLPSLWIVWRISVTL